VNKLRFSSGCVIGADHVKSKKNCQDALFMIEKPDLMVAFVADGCGDSINSPFSEVGSRLGVTTVVNRVVAKLDSTTKWGRTRYLQSTHFWQDVQKYALDEMDISAIGMGGSYRKNIINHFLFTLVGLVVTPEITLIVGIGDGYYFFNEMKNELRPNPVDNMPPYLAFNLVETTLKKMSPEELKLKVVKSMATKDVESVMIATDGLGGVLSDPMKIVPGTKELVGGPDQFWNNKEYFENTFSLGWRLNQLATEKKIIKWEERRADIQPAIITDDLALVVGSRV
jgi:hypothetical protein